MPALVLSAVLGAAPLGGQYLEFLGWTKDGASFVWTVGVPNSASDCEGPDCDGSDAYIASISTTAIVRSARTGEEQRFELENIPQRGKEKPTRLAGYDAFQTWKKSHPLVKLTRLAGSTAGVTVNGEELQSFEEEEVDAVFYTTRQGAKVTLQRPMGGPDIVSRTTSVSTWFDPTGRRVVFELSVPSGRHSRGEVPPSSELLVLAAGTTVSVLSTDDKASVREAVASKVEAAGFAVVSMGTAQKARKSTVIYFAPAHKKAAEKLAKAIDGATIEPLTWKPNEHLVVAVGE